MNTDETHRFSHLKVIRVYLCVSVAAFAAVTAGAACAQDYPSQPIRLIGSSPGGGSDTEMRLIAPTLRAALGQPVVIDNRSSILIGDIGAKSPPDGHTVVVVGNSFIIQNLLRETAWDPVRDFLPVTLADAGPSVLITHPSVP